jgi:hypothetical protein
LPSPEWATSFLQTCSNRRGGGTHVTFSRKQHSGTSRPMAQVISPSRSVFRQPVKSQAPDPFSSSPPSASETGSPVNRLGHPPLPSASAGDASPVPGRTSRSRAPPPVLPGAVAAVLACRASSEASGGGGGRVIRPPPSTHASSGAPRRAG